MQDFVDQVYVPDTLAIASFYKDWFARGEGVGNFMTFGDFPADGMGDPVDLADPVGGDPEPRPVHDPPGRPDRSRRDAGIRRRIPGTTIPAGKTEGLHPYDGETDLNYTGPKPPYEQLDVEQSYSWLKSPRWKGNVMEVGPLARVLMLYAKGHEPTMELANMALRSWTCR